MILTMIVEDERLTLETLAARAATHGEFLVVGRFSDSLEALAFARECRAEGKALGFALLDVEMPEMNGMELGAQLKTLFPQIILIYVTAHGRYALEAIQLKADYFVMKPFSKQDIDEAFHRALLLSARQDKKVTIKAFGNFEVLLNGKRLLFTNAKAMELFALCVNAQGAPLSINDAVSILWEGRTDDVQVKKLYRKAIIYLDSLFEAESVSGVFVHVRGSCWVDPAKVRCDYYDYLDGDRSLFKGRYMSQYEWGEETLGELMNVDD